MYKSFRARKSSIEVGVLLQSWRQRGCVWLNTKQNQALCQAKPLVAFFRYRLILLEWPSDEWVRALKVCRLYLSARPAPSACAIFSIPIVIPFKYLYGYR